MFRDGDEVEIGSRNERPMTRYFPELVAAIKAELPERCVIDGASASILAISSSGIATTLLHAVMQAHRLSADDGSLSLCAHSYDD